MNRLQIALNRHLQHIVVKEKRKHGFIQFPFFFVYYVSNLICELCNMLIILNCNLKYT